MLDNDPKNILFEWWCKLINYFEPEIHFQFNYGNMEIDRDEYSKDFKIAFKEDSFNLVRKEYSDMLINQFSKGTNNLKKERYLTYGIKATDYKTAKLKLGKINKQLEKNFRISWTDMSGCTFCSACFTPPQKKNSCGTLICR